MLCIAVTNSHKDLVQPNETHLEGVPFFIQHPKPIYYTMKDHPAVIECTAEPVSHAAIECAEKIIPYKGPEESGRLKVTRLDATNRPSPNGDRWHLALQVRPKEVEEWFDSYVCRCEAWNKVVALQRPKKVISKATIVMEAYLDRKFLVEPTSTNLDAGERLELNCVPPEGKPAPVVFWIKNGTRINSKLFPQVDINDHGQLVIKNTVGSDSGNYTCVAELLGLEYRYANAEVRIFERTNNVGLDSPDYNSRSAKVLDERRDLVSVPDVLTYTSVFLFLTFMLFTLFAVLFAKRRGSISRLIQRLNDKYCAQTKNVYHKQKNGKLAADPLLLNDYNHGWVGVKTLADHTVNDVPQINSPRSVSLNVIANRHVDSTIPRQAVTVYETLDAKRCTPKYTDPRNSPSECTSHTAPTSSVFVPLPPPPSSLPPTPASNQSLEHFDYSSRLGNEYQARMQERHFFISNTSRASCPFGSPRNSRNPNKLELRIPPTLSDFALCLNKRSSSTVCGNLRGCQTQSICVSPTSQQVAASYTAMHSPGGKCSTNSATNTLTISSGNEDDSPSDRERIPYARFSDTEIRPISKMENAERSPYDIYSRPNGLTNGGESTLSLMPVQTLRGVNKIVRGLVNATGGSLKLENSDVMLTIPKDTFSSTTYRPIELTIFREDRVRPTLKDCQTLLSPIIQYGPQNLELLYPALLSFPHCADLSRGSWTVTLLVAPYLPMRDPQSESMEYLGKNVPRQDSGDSLYDSSFYGAGVGNQWKPVSVIALEEQQYGLCRLDLSAVQLLTQFPQRYCLIGERSNQHTASRSYPSVPSQRLTTSENGDSTHILAAGCIPRETTHSIIDSGKLHAIKLLCFAAFAGPLTPGMDFSVRVYVLPKTKDALAHVKEVESGSDGHLLDVLDHFSFRDSGTGICFQMDEVSFGWKSKLQMDRQEIPFRHVWRGVHTSLLHCSFSFEPMEPVQTCISCKLSVFQCDLDSERSAMYLFSSYSK